MVMNECIWWADCYSSTLIEGSAQRANVVIESLDGALGAKQGSADPVAHRLESTAERATTSSVLLSHPKDVYLPFIGECTGLRSIDLQVLSFILLFESARTC